MDRKDITELLDKVKAGTASPAEEAAVKRWLHQLNENDASGLSDDDLAQGRAAMWQAIQQAQHSRVRPLWTRIAAAASILLVLGAGSYFVLRPKGNVVLQPEAMLPATQGITLRVAGQKPIIIAYHHKGQINDKIDQTDSLLRYQTGTNTAEMQTLTNNSGHKITVQLADGTETILDVATTLTYPSAFTGKERRVSLNGQAYFKVQHNAEQPFFVDYHGQTTEDIGTEFNIHAYDNEPSATTLVSGSIKVDRQILKPGEQLIEGKIQPANLFVVMAWLQDKMELRGETLENFMRNVARIYHVTIVWEDATIRGQTFGGTVRRNTTLASVLNFVRETGKADFRVDGKTIYVTKPKKINKQPIVKP
ncbi:MAG TPA: FecR domain-containing protein [Mucilaginibacter sp.]|jgi:ferric-dicitrate binding protein FerR (iron transport regulator)